MDLDDFIRRYFGFYPFRKSVISRIFDDTWFDRTWEDLENMAREGEAVVYGWSFRVGPDGKPVFREFGNVPGISNKETGSKRIPFIDVNDSKDKINITAELPGVNKEDIEVTIEGKKLHIYAKHRDREYEGSVELSEEVNNNPEHSTFKNGVLDITFRKLRNRKSKIKVD